MSRTNATNLGCAFAIICVIVSVIIVVAALVASRN